MTGAVIAGVFTLCACGATVWLHWKLREEKFKEAVYENKLAFYKELAVAVHRTALASAEFSLRRCKPSLKQLDPYAIPKDLGEEAKKLVDLAGGGLFIAEPVNVKIQEFWLESQKSFFEYMADPKKVLTLDQFSETVAAVEKKYLEAINAMRKDLQVSAIESSILKMFQVSTEAVEGAWIEKAGAEKVDG
ncbi:MAG: hypothetical protein A4E60_00967 [Syntrophorhabdus sp. PtaB.Bin047]|jgi:hypothetical protein|nr:MAG: hypothetical protein A4E60_00967 [Syntrophorhabdus sp. PtaB.Bin047]